MNNIIFEDQTYPCASGDDVLTTLLNADKKVPHNCRIGTCQTCLMKMAKGTPPEASQKGLKDSLVAQNYFLACQCHPETDMNISSANDKEIRYQSQIISIQHLSDDVIQLIVTRPDQFNCRAGQYLNIWINDEVARTYSIASPTNSTHLEFHIRIIEQGKFSTWLAQSAQVNELIQLQEPVGDCFYIEGSAEQDLLLIGTGTGLSPLQGILLDALSSHHQGQIDLFHGALNSKGLYNTKLLSEVSQQHANFNYHPCVVEADPKHEYLTGDIADIVFQKITSMKNKKVYLCGNPQLVKQLKTKVFLAGVDSKNIYTDAFEPSQSCS